MATAVKSHTRGVRIVDRHTFLTTLSTGLAKMASRILATEPPVGDLFPTTFDITVDGRETQAWIHTVTYTDMYYVTVEVQYLFEDDQAETTITVAVELNLDATDEEIDVFETAWGVEE